MVAGIMLLFSCSGGVELSGRPGPTPAPTNLKAEPTADGVRLKWDPVAGATKYTVFWGAESGDYRNMADSLAPEIVLSRLAAEERYSFVVTAWNQKGESSFSNEASLVNDIDPRRASHYLAKGNELLKQGLYDDAQLYFSTAIRLDPNDPQAYQRRGLLYERTSRQGLAEQDYSLAASLIKKKKSQGVSPSRKDNRENN